MTFVTIGALRVNYVPLSKGLGNIRKIMNWSEYCLEIVEECSSSLAEC